MNKGIIPPVDMWTKARDVLHTFLPSLALARGRVERPSRVERPRRQVRGFGTGDCLTGTLVERYDDSNDW